MAGQRGQGPAPPINYDALAARARQTTIDYDALAEQARKTQDTADASSSTPPPVGRFLSSLISTLNPITMVTGAAHAIAHPYDTASAIVKSQGDELAKAGERFKAAREASRDSLKVGAMNASEGMGHLLAGLLPIIGPAAAHAGERGASGDVAGALGEGTGLISATVLGPAAARGMMNATKSGAINIAGRTMGTTDAGLAEQALKARVLPGVIRSGLSKTERKIAPIVKRVDETLNAPAGQTPVRITNAGPAVRQAWDEIYARTAPEGQADANAALAAFRAHPKLTNPTARNLFDLSEGSRMKAAGPSPRAVMERALTSDLRGDIGRAVPPIATDLSRINELAPIEEAFRNAPNSPFRVGALPTIQSRIAAAFVNRLASPTAQALYTVMRPLPTAATSADILRAAMMAAFAGKQDQQR